MREPVASGHKLKLPFRHLLEREGDLAHELIEIPYCEIEAVLLRDNQLNDNRRISANITSRLHDPNWHGELPGNEPAGLERVRGVLFTGIPGYGERISELSSVLGDLVPPLGIGRRKWQRSARGGDEIDVQRFCDGKEDFWIDYNRSGARPNRCLTLVGQIGANSIISPEEMFWQGAATCCVVDLLEDAGFTVRLIAQSCLRDQSRCLFTGDTWGAAAKTRLHKAIILKDFGEPLRMGPVSLAMCSAGFYRTFGFHMICCSAFMQDISLGSSAGLNKADVEHFHGEASFIVPKCDTKYSAQAAVAATIEAVRAKLSGSELAAV